MSEVAIRNPFRPGAGHMPPYLAGRQHETVEFERLLGQDVILENLVLTGLRGVGKTVLLDTFKPIAIGRGWVWVGTDLSESMSITEERIAIRLITDLSVITSTIAVATQPAGGVGFRRESRGVDVHLDYPFLLELYDATPGMVADKIKAILMLAWAHLERHGYRGVVFAYDEAQNLADHSGAGEYPLSLLLDVFQSIQKADIPFLLALAGLPTLFPRLVEARTFAERMFHVVVLDRLDARDSREAIRRPIEAMEHPISLSGPLIDRLTGVSGGYPYFLQFLGREVFDFALQRPRRGKIASRLGVASVPFEQIVRKLDNDFFAGRWARATDRQRDLMTVIAGLPHGDEAFSVQEVVERARETLPKPFSPSQVSQMFSKLAEAGLIYRNRHGRHSFAIPLLGPFIRRQAEADPRSRAPDRPPTSSRHS